MKSKILLGFLVLGLNLSVFAEKNSIATIHPPFPVEIEEEEVFIPNLSCFVEVLASFAGCTSGRIFFRFIDNNITRNTARRIAQRPVIFSFVIEKDGSISNVEILEGINARTNEDIIRVVKLSAQFWHPHRLSSCRYVKTYLTFDLQRRYFVSYKISALEIEE